MGLGHRVYRVRDPRAAVLEGAIDELEAAGISTRRLDLARAVEAEAFALLRERLMNRVRTLRAAAGLGASIMLLSSFPFLLNAT